MQRVTSSFRSTLCKTVSLDRQVRLLSLPGCPLGLGHLAKRSQKAKTETTTAYIMCDAQEARHFVARATVVT